MKTILLSSLFTILSCLSQPRQELFRPFLNFVATKRQLSPNIVNECKWQYALVKVTCNQNNKIVKHKILNPVTKEIEDYFKFLDGYQFGKNILINKHSIVFCMTFENHDTDCILKTRALPTDGLKEVYSQLESLLLTEPKSIVLFSMISTAYNVSSKIE